MLGHSQNPQRRPLLAEGIVFFCENGEKHKEALTLLPGLRVNSSPLLDIQDPVFQEILIVERAVEIRDYARLKLSLAQQWLSEEYHLRSFQTAENNAESSFNARHAHALHTLGVKGYFVEQAGLEIPSLPTEDNPGAYFKEVVSEWKESSLLNSTESDFGEVLWEKVQSLPDLGATFHSWIAYCDSGGEIHTLHAELQGRLVSPQGEREFGWDRCFQPLSMECTLAELSLEEKNGVSPRGVNLERLKGMIWERYKGGFIKEEEK